MEMIKGIKNNAIEYKTLTSEKFHVNFERRKVSGYFAAFDIVDSDEDIIRQGAFSESIEKFGPGSTNNRKIKYLHQHRLDEIAGPLTELREDEKGLYFEGNVEESALGDIILTRYKDGTYNEHSIGFRYTEDCEWIEIPVEVQEGAFDDNPSIMVFECRKLFLFEGSVVTFGANSQTPFAGFKGNNEDQIRQLNDEFEFILKKCSTFDEEIRLRQLWEKQKSLLLSHKQNEDFKNRTKNPKKELDLEYVTRNFKL